MFELIDQWRVLRTDGTLDIGVKCSECGKELHYDYDYYGHTGGHTTYRDFADWAVKHANSNHKCKGTRRR